MYARETGAMYARETGAMYARQTGAMYTRKTGEMYARKTGEMYAKEIDAMYAKEIDVVDVGGEEEGKEEGEEEGEDADAVIHIMDGAEEDKKTVGVDQEVALGSAQCVNFVPMHIYSTMIFTTMW